MAKKHPNKHIREALKYATDQGWTLASGRGHAFGVLRCPAGTREGCQKSVWSTPRNPECHARDLIASINACSH